MKPDGTETKSDASQQKPKTATSPPRIFSNYDAESFQKLEEAQQKINLDHVNHDLLSAAVFHETNQRRLTEKLPPLDYELKLGDAAKMQAVIMEERGSISHVNQESPGKETPTDRLRLAGLEAGYSAENVATAFALSYPKESLFTPGKRTGRRSSASNLTAPRSHSIPTSASPLPCLTHGWPRLPTVKISSHPNPSFSARAASSRPTKPPVCPSFIVPKSSSPR